MQIIAIDNGRLVAKEHPIPLPGPHEVLIKVEAAGVNHADLYQVQGKYPPPENAPDWPGLEVSGTVEAIGSDIQTLEKGEPVCALLPGGGYAEYVCISEALVLSAPQGCELKHAAALPEACATVYLNLFELGKLNPGQTALIHGGTSGIGVIAIQAAKALGAKVITTARTQEKCEFLQTLGADTVINYQQEDFVEITKEAGGVDLVLDIVGGDYIERNFRALKPHGKMISIAFLKGPKAEMNCGPLLMKNLTWQGSTLRSKSLQEKYEIMESVRNVFWPWIEQGKIKPVIDSTFTLSQAEDAHKHMESSNHIGKILLLP